MHLIDRVRAVERDVALSGVKTLSILLGSALGLWILAGAIGIVGLVLKDSLADWPESVKMALFGLAALVAIPGFLVAGAVGLGAPWLLGEGMVNSAERAPWIAGAALAVAGFLVARRTSLIIREEELVRERTRAEEVRRRVVAKPHLLEEPAIVDLLAPQMASVKKAQSEAFVQVLNRWLVGSVLSVIVVAAAFVLLEP